jgi:hypothetical protein
MKTKRKNIKYKKTNIKRYIFTKKTNKKRNYLTKKRNMRFKGGMDNDKKRKRDDLEESKEDDVCGICLEEFNQNDETLTCSNGHKFHKDELINWCSRYNRINCSCPICKQSINEIIAPFIPNQTSSPIQRQTILNYDNNAPMTNQEILDFLDDPNQTMTIVDLISRQRYRRQRSGNNYHINELTRFMESPNSREYINNLINRMEDIPTNFEEE